MLLDLPRPTAPALPEAPLGRLTAWLRGKAAVRAAATRLARRDAATGLAERRVATLWLHAAAGMAARRGERLAIAVVKAPTARPSRVAAAIAEALPVGGMAARWDDGRYLVAAPQHAATALMRRLDAALDAYGVEAALGFAEGTDPDAMLAAANAA